MELEDDASGQTIEEDKPMQLLPAVNRESVTMEVLVEGVNEGEWILGNDCNSVPECPEGKD